MGFSIAIVGRPNVGKSTLFNRLIGGNKAIVDDVSGVTRDRIYGKSEWNGKKFSVIDTGGVVEKSIDVFELNIKKQVELALEESSAIIFTVDVTTGITDLDEYIARTLRKVKKPVFLVVNKVDNSDRFMAANEFWALGFEKITLKNNKMLSYFLSKQDSDYYNSPMFKAVLSYAQKTPKQTALKEQNNKLWLTIENIKSVDEAIVVLEKITSMVVKPVEV